LPVFILKGFKLIAVGERCATPTESTIERDFDPEGVTLPMQFDPFRVRRRFVCNSVGVAQRSPTAINLNPFGIEPAQAYQLKNSNKSCHDAILIAFGQKRRVTRAEP
jgi:hypothetical protein